MVNNYKVFINLHIIWKIVQSINFLKQGTTVMQRAGKYFHIKKFSNTSNFSVLLLSSLHFYT